MREARILMFDFQFSILNPNSSVNNPVILLQLRT